MAQTKSRGMRDWEARHGGDVGAELRRFYLEEGLTLEQTAVAMQTSYGNVHRWAKRLGIPARRPIWVAQPLAAVS